MTAGGFIAGKASLPVVVIERGEACASSQSSSSSDLIRRSIPLPFRRSEAVRRAERAYAIPVCLLAKAVWIARSSRAMTEGGFTVAVTLKRVRGGQTALVAAFPASDAPGRRETPSGRTLTGTLLIIGWPE